MNAKQLSPVRVLSAVLGALVLVACSDPTTPPTPSPGLMDVAVYLLDPADMEEDCSAVVKSVRTVPKTEDTLQAALDSLVGGITAEETGRGLISWFSQETADALNSVRLEGNTAFVDFKDFSGTIPNASSSCGSASLLAQLDSTVAANGPGGVRACYSFDGDPEAFYYWLQLVVSDACNG